MYLDLFKDCDNGQSNIADVQETDLDSSFLSEVSGEGRGLPQVARTGGYAMDPKLLPISTIYNPIQAGLTSLRVRVKLKNSLPKPLDGDFDNQGLKSCVRKGLSKPSLPNPMRNLGYSPVISKRWTVIEGAGVGASDPPKSGGRLNSDHRDSTKLKTASINLLEGENHAKKAEVFFAYRERFGLSSKLRRDASPRQSILKSSTTQANLSFHSNLLESPRASPRIPKKVSFNKMVLVAVERIEDYC